MAQLKQLSAGSSQIIMMMFRDKNNAPIKADSVHVKGSIFTGNGAPFEFEVNKGVCTNCKIQNDMLLFNIVPLLGLGQMQVYTQTFLGDTKAITGIYISENQQKLGVEVVNKGTFLSDRQGAMWVDVYLPIEINTAAQIPWVPAGADEQWIKDYLDKYVTTPAFAATLAALGGASKDLSNVDLKDFEDKGKQANFAQNDLVDVDLKKLQEKGNDAGLANNDLSNIPLNIFNRFVRQSAAYQKLANMPHPATQGKTDEQIKALFYANRFEEQQGVNLSQDPYNKATTLMMVYQMSNGQTIQQTLPPLSDNRIIWVELIKEPNAAGYKAVFAPKAGEQINGATTPITLTDDGFEGIFVPLQNESTWEFIPYHRYDKSNLSGQDDFGTIIDAINAMYFKKPLKLKYNNDTKQVELSVEGDFEMSFVDTVLQKNFKSALGQSMDGSIMIKPVLIGKDDDGKDVYKVDFSVAKTAAQEGIAKMAEYTQIINLDYPDNQPRFDNVLYKGGQSVYINQQTGGIVVQEIDGGDPNVTGGTLFLAILDYSPDKSQDNKLTQDGKIRLALTDSGGNYIKTLDGGNAVVERTYKAGDEIRDMRLAVLFRATTYTEVFYKIEGDFANEEAISVGLGSGICVQSIEPNSGMGDALIAYEVYTGSHVEIGKINYSTNNINFARVLVKDGLAQVGGNNTSNLGNNLFFDIRTSMSTQIINNSLKIEANAPPCVFSIYKIYNKADLRRLNGRNIEISVDLMNKDSAMRLVMMGYKGTDPTTSPKLLSYNNGQPQYNAGWTEIDSLFIAENAVSDRHKETKTFTFQSADNYETCTFLLRPENGAVPVNVTIYDIEGDIKPGFVFAGVKELYTAEQMTLIKKDMFTKSAILCPIAYSAYRYTFNTDDTKIPVGIFKNNEFVRNNNAWYDAKSIGKQDQGDIEVLKSFRGSLSYSLNIFNEQATDSSVTIWLARVEKDGTFTKIADSEMVVSVSANTTPSVINEVTKPAFVHNFRKGESYRWFARADKTDGAYIQCNSGSHIPMTEIIIDVEYYTEIPEDILRENGVAKIKLMDGANEVKDPENYTIQIDVKTGAVTIKKK